MNFSGVYHRSSDNFCYCRSEDELVISIKTGYDVKAVSIMADDPYKAGIMGGGESWDGTERAMTCRRLAHHLWWSICLRPEFKRLKYYFKLQTEEESWLYFEDGFVTAEQMHLPGRSRQCFIMPWMNPADVAKPPAWVKDTIWYQIFPDRFCNGDHSLDPEGVLPWREDGPVEAREFFGGDLAGIASKLDYLEELGVGGIYLTPINEAPSVHKYDTKDYTKIDPHFGDEATFKALVEELHSRGMRVMIDGVFNHSGALFEPWRDVLSNGPQSPYFDWFMVNNWPVNAEGQGARNKDFYSFAFIDGMPKLNTNNPELRSYIIGICEDWVRKYDVDGLRLDVANETSHAFCKELHHRLKALKPDLYIMGEIWHDSLPWLRGDEYDSVMNYPLAEGIRDYWVDEARTSEDFERFINRCHTAYMSQTNEVLFNMLDSHDTARLIHRVGSLDTFFAQLAIAFCLPGSPCIYYGTEIALPGGHDPDCRRCMPWARIAAGEFDDTKADVTALIRLRNSEPLLKSQSFDFPYSYGEDSRVIQMRKLADCASCDSTAANATRPTAVELLINPTAEPLHLQVLGQPLFARGLESDVLQPGGVLIHRI